MKPCGEASSRKGALTRIAILDTAIAMVSQDGLDGLTIGRLADAMRMGKSSVFSHFGSRDALLLEVLKHYRRKFEKVVFMRDVPALHGIARLEAFFMRWSRQVASEAGCCVYLRGVIECAALPATAHEELLAMVHALHAALQLCIVEAIANGDLHADTSPRQLVFEISGLIASLYHDAHFLQRGESLQCAQSGFVRLTGCYRPAGRALAA